MRNEDSEDSTDDRKQEERQFGGEGDGPNVPVARGEEPRLEERLAALEVERDEIKDRMLRVAAEFENWKKRARKEQDEAESKARESVLRDMLDVIDNLDRAVGAYGAGGGATTGRPAGAGAPVDGPAILKGVGLVLRLFQSKLDRYGIKPIIAEGQPFDPRQHEAISRVETADVAPGTVARELQRGYRIGERLLRPALVSVATAPGSVPRPEGGTNGAGGVVEDKPA